MMLRECWPHFAAGDLSEQITMATQSVLSLALRPREAAKALGISPRLLWQLTQDGEIPCVHVGGGKRQIVLYPTSDLQAWLTRRTRAASPRINQQRISAEAGSPKVIIEAGILIHRVPSWIWLLISWLVSDVAF
jgi:excisionase family DNA binding protein